eukprot:165663_1
MIFLYCLFISVSTAIDLNFGVPTFKPSINNPTFKPYEPPSFQTYEFAKMEPPSLYVHQQREKRMFENTNLGGAHSFGPIQIESSLPKPVPAPIPPKNLFADKVWVPTHDSISDHLAGEADPTKGVWKDKSQCTVGSDGV